ncbi:MAG: hypothetical protein F6K28_49470 [Microcoleus sp. SIO2G3]|nr:hypothetical protein [Microcoleus sp. SIO2G3]
MRQAIAKFQKSGRTIAQGGLSLIEVLESITKQPLPAHLQHHLLREFSCSSSAFAEKLIQSGYVDHDQMQQALTEAHKSGIPLMEILESITGHQLPPDFLRQSKKQLLFELKILYGVESLDLETQEINWHQVGQLIDTFIPVDICSRYRLVPVAKTETQPLAILVAMVDPDNLDAQDDLIRILRPQGIGLQRMVITQEDYQQLISKYLDEQLARQKQLEVEKALDVKENLESFNMLQDAPDAVEMDLDSSLNDVVAASVINMVNKIMAKALQIDQSSAATSRTRATTGGTYSSVSTTEKRD